MTLLSVDEVGIEIGGRQLVTSASLAVDPGECTGMVGESGSGKTLVCRAITGGLQRLGGSIDRGSIVFDGVDLASLSAAGWARIRGRRIAFIPQNSLTSLDPIMTVGRQLTATLRLFGHGKGARERAMQLLTQVQLSDPERVFASYSHELSGGMRQRVMIALAVSGEPNLLVADEPTTALDVTVQRGILDLLRMLQRDTGMAMLLVSHDLGIVETVCQRVVVMYAGVTVENGLAADVLGQPAHPYTQALRGADPRHGTPGEFLDGIPGLPPRPEDWGPGCRFAQRCQYCRPECLAALPPYRPIAPDHVAACIRSDLNGDANH